MLTPKQQTNHYHWWSEFIFACGNHQPVCFIHTRRVVRASL